MNSFKLSTLGVPSTRASIMRPSDICRFVCLYKRFKTTWALASFFISMTMRMPSRSDSSRMSDMPSTRLSFTRSAMDSMSFALLT